MLAVGAERIDRKFVPATDWPHLLADLDHLDAGPLAASTTLARLLCGEQAPAITVQYLSKVAVTADPPQVAAALDGLLRAAVPPRLALRPEPPP